MISFLTNLLKLHWLHYSFSTQLRIISKNLSLWNKLIFLLNFISSTQSSTQNFVYFSSTFLLESFWQPLGRGPQRTYTSKAVVFLFTRLKLALLQPPNEKRKRLVSQWRSCLKAGLAEFESRRLPLSRSSCIPPISQTLMSP